MVREMTLVEAGVLKETKAFLEQFIGGIPMNPEICKVAKGLLQKLDGELVTAPSPKWHDVPLTKILLHLIICVQSYAEHKGQESILLSKGVDHEDWRDAAFQYFQSLPNEMLQLFHLSRNFESFNTVMNYNITEGMRVTKSIDLSKKYTVRVWGE